MASRPTAIVTVQVANHQLSRLVLQNAVLQLQRGNLNSSVGAGDVPERWSSAVMLGPFSGRKLLLAQPYGFVIIHIG
jgi:hypothetical protein